MSLPSRTAAISQDTDHSAAQRRRDSAKPRRSPRRHLELVDPPPPSAGTASGSDAGTGTSEDSRSLTSRFIVLTENMVHVVVAVVLMGVAIAMLVNTADTIATHPGSIQDAARTSVGGALFAVIIVEIMRIVLAHFDGRGLLLQPFLIIGIISAVRAILTAHLSLYGPAASSGSALSELGINAAVVLGLTGSLVLVSRFAGIGLGSVRRST